MKNNVPISERSSKTLAAQIVAFRVLGLNKEDAILAMEELHKRKINGDDFDYNKYIDDKIKETPQPNANINNSDLLKKVLKYVK